MPDEHNREPDTEVDELAHGMLNETLHGHPPIESTMILAESVLMRGEQIQRLIRELDKTVSRAADNADAWRAADAALKSIREAVENTLGKPKDKKGPYTLEEGELRSFCFMLLGFLDRYKASVKGVGHEKED